MKLSIYQKLLLHLIGRILTSSTLMTVGTEVTCQGSPLKILEGVFHLSTIVELSASPQKTWCACLLGLLANINNHCTWPIFRTESILDGPIYCYTILAAQPVRTVCHRCTWDSHSQDTIAVRPRARSRKSRIVLLRVPDRKDRKEIRLHGVASVKEGPKVVTSGEHPRTSMLCLWTCDDNKLK